MEPVGVVETSLFLAATQKLMSDDDRALLIDYLAWNPESGDLIPGTAESASCDGLWKDAENAAVRA